MSVGRLDINTEGLMLLTNDGGLTKVLAHPETGWLRRYRVRAHGHVEQAALDGLRAGISLDGVDYGPIGATLEREVGDNAWLTLDLREGKNREIKRVLEHLGLQVTRLIRVSFGPFQLEDLGAGAVEEVRTRTLKDQLGPKLIEQANAWFEGPRRDSVAETQAMLAAATPPKPKRFDRRKPGEKRDQAILGEAPDLKVSREKVADRRGRNVQVERIVRVEAPDAPLREERPAKEERRGKPFRDRDDRPPRREGDRPYRPRQPRDEAGESGERPFRARPQGDRPPRRDGDRPYRPRPPRDDAGAGGERPFRARPQDDRPPRRDGDRPYRPRPPRNDAGGGGERPFRGKSSGPGGGKPHGGRPGGGKRPPRERG
jgi:23S rRNA pseudouridine2605 synthase